MILRYLCLDVRYVEVIYKRKYGNALKGIYHFITTTTANAPVVAVPAAAPSLVLLPYQLLLLSLFTLPLMVPRDPLIVCAPHLQSALS